MAIAAPAFFPVSETDQAGPVGIARMAAEATRAEERNEVDYKWIDCRSALNRVNGSRVTFEWSINPYRGCEIGCAYCYARYTHEFMEHHDPIDFERKIYIKRSAARRLKMELRGGKYRAGEVIVIGAATDPYQPAEKRFEATRSILEVLAEETGLRIGILTKSDLILRDRDLLSVIARRHELKINMTVTTTDHALARRTEPRAVAPRRRLSAVRLLNDAGIVAGVFLMPIMPAINDQESGIESLAREAAQSHAAFLGYETLFLTKSIRRHFDVFLREQFPQLLHLYRNYYRNGSDPPPDYRGMIASRVDRIRKKYGLRLPSELETESAGAAKGDYQPDLFE